MDRRDFLTGTAGLSGLLLLNSCNLKKKYFHSGFDSGTRFLVAAGEEQIRKINDIYSHSTSSNASLCIAGMNDEIAYIPTPGKVHQIEKVPGEKSLYFAATKWGKEACLIDIDKKALVMDLRAPGTDYFYGHCIFSSDGKFLFVSMSNETERRGYISVRDSKSLNEIRRFPSYGQLPHQMRWFQEDKILAVMNNLPLDIKKDKFRSELNFINVATGELISSYSTSISRHAHFELSEDKTFALLYRSSFIGETTLFEKLDLKSGQLTVSYENSPFKIDSIESLNSVLFEDQSTAAITINMTNELVFWNYKINKVIHVETFPDNPICINTSDDGENIILKFSSNDRKKFFMKIYKTADFRRMKFNSFKTIDGGGSGSHLTIVS